LGGHDGRLAGNNSRLRGDDSGLAGDNTQGIGLSQVLGGRVTLFIIGISGLLGRVFPVVNAGFIGWNHTYLAGAGAGVSGDGTHGQGRERGDDEGGTHFDGVLLRSWSENYLEGDVMEMWR
jgi:hypothetical protein